MTNVKIALKKPLIIYNAEALGLAVSRDHRRRGVGRALITCAENWAKEQGVNIVRLNSGSTRKEAHEFYRAMGYDDEKMQVRFLKKLN